LKITTLRRAGSRVVVGGSVSSKASGTVTVRYRVRLHGRTRTLSKRVRIRRRAFRTTLMLARAYAAPRVVTVSVAYGGDLDTTSQTRTSTLRLKP
jgi:hypothetical protein